MSGEDDLMRRADAWTVVQPEQWDRMDMAEHIGRGRAVVRALIDRVDELELRLEDAHEVEVPQ